MLGLKIQDEIRWHDRWSAEIGKNLDVVDSTNDMYIFDRRYSREDIMKVLGEVPEDLYQLFEVEGAPEENCDYMADSGRCYRRLH